MMKTVLSFLTILFFASCSTDNTSEFVAQLPSETQSGANTFGCVINGQVFYPRDGESSLFNPGGREMIFWGSPGIDRIWNEIEVRNLRDGKPCSIMIIHIQGLFQNQIWEYILKSSNFQNSIDGLMQNYVFARIYDSVSNTWKLYGTFENSGKVTITKYGNIVAGNFSCKLRLQNGLEEIEIKNGRFDFNGSTLPTTKFP